MKGFSDRLELHTIPEGPGGCLIEDVNGNLLQIAATNNIRRRVGELMDSQGTICVHGPKIYKAQQEGQKIFVRWKLTADYKEEKKRLMEQYQIAW
jgi:hypothetical protein